MATRPLVLPYSSNCESDGKYVHRLTRRDMVQRTQCAHRRNPCCGSRQRLKALIIGLSGQITLPHTMSWQSWDAALSALVQIETVSGVSDREYRACWSTSWVDPVMTWEAGVKSSLPTVWDAERLSCVFSRHRCTLLSHAMPRRRPPVNHSWMAVFVLTCSWYILHSFPLMFPSEITHILRLQLAKMRKSHRHASAYPFM